MSSLSKGIKIGLTGSIASGKSTALDVFKAHGFFVFSADHAVSELYHDIDFVHHVKQVFPHIIVDQTIDKSRLLQSLNDPVFYDQYIDMIHHGVLMKMLHFQKQHHNEKTVCEIPLLFEVSWESYFDEVWVIVVSDEVSFKRATSRGMSQQTYAFLKNKQWSIEKKRAHGTVLVHNEGTKEEFIQALTYRFKERGL